ncbi:TonB-dependent receptor domain-containing protein [Azoarcus taiwanensis]|uniref:TonB-dependent receptor n=1 Tax=Azoarcus taiwanensis TaxID=666964 RepID=A0A972J8N3_9RHOO|nr:TonB-dependent receptor [Azoarcus taiwanensis]NMG03516.1 TonB-dependent receptor [Azoarcus taiwanensis]
MKIRLTVTALAVAAAFPAFSQSAVTTDEATLATTFVTATRQAQRVDQVLASVEVITREEIERAGHSTLTDVLKRVSGVRVVTNGGPGANASVFVRGAESRHTLLLIDGLRVNSVNSGQPTLEAIPLAIIDRIEILRGPASALYGSDAIGGVIQIFTRRGETGFSPELFVGYGSYDTVNLGASVSGGHERVRYSLSAGRERTRGFNSKHDETFWYSTWGPSTSYDSDRDGFNNAYMSGSLSVGFRERDEIGINLFHTQGRNEYDVSRLLTEPRFNSRLDKQVSSVGIFMRNEITDIWTSTVRVGQSDDHLNNRPSAIERNRIRSRQQQFVWQHDVTLPLGSLMAAYEYVRSEAGGDTGYVEDSRRVHALLLGWSASIGDHSVQLNVRHDDNSQFGSKTTGMLGYGYRISPDWSVHGSIATAFNAPTFNQLYWPDSGFGGGNPALKPERALNRELGVRWDDGFQSVEVTYYNNRVRDMISGWPPQNLNQAKLEGFEIAYGTHLAGFDIRAGVDLINAKDRVSGNRLPRRARESAFVQIEHSVGRWDWGVDWYGERGRFENVANTVELGGYGVLDAYAHYRVAPDWRIEFRANNLLDKKYELSRGYATAGANAFVGVRYTPR